MESNGKCQYKLTNNKFSEAHFKSSTSQMKMRSKISEEFKTSKRLLQGCFMSRTLFKINIDNEMWEIGSNANKCDIYF